MACRIREELVGKRFLSVKSEGKLKVGKISDWEWRPGFVRAVSTRDTTSADFTVLVEFDDTGWKCREHIKVHQVFQEFLVEHTLAWVDRRTGQNAGISGQWPALCFRAVVDKVGLFQHNKRPVEFLNDRALCIVEERDIQFYREGDENSRAAVRDSPDILKWVKAWLDYQDGQKILLTTPTVLLGYRVEVYRTDGTTQWYTAVIKSYNHSTKSLTLTDDTVLEEHNEDPALIQMHLIGDGVVDSILSGVDVGVAQRRRPRCTVTKQNSKDSSSIINIGRAVTSLHSCISTVAESQAKNSTSVAAFSTTTTTVAAASSVNSAASSGGSGAKLRSAVEAVTSLPVGSLEGPGIKGQNQHKKQTLKRKPSPPPRAAKKTPAGRRTKKSTSDDSSEASAPVCKQTCNVLVKRIEEDNSKNNQDKPKLKSLRARDKPVQGSDTRLQNRIKAAESPEARADTRDIKSVESSGNRPASRGFKQAQSSDTRVESREPVQSSDTRGGLADVSSGSKDEPLSEVRVTKERRTRGDTRKEREERNDRGETFDDKQGLIEARTLETARDAVNYGRNLIYDSPSVKPNARIPKDAGSANNGVISSAPPLSSRKGKLSYLSGSRNEDKPANLKTAAVKNDLVVEERENRQPVGETPEKKIAPNPLTSGGDSSNPKSEEDMHYKKQILRAGGSNSPPAQSSQAPALSEGFDVTRSLTEQLAKRKSGDAYSVNGDGKTRAEAAVPAEILSQSGLMFSQYSDRDRSESSSIAKLHEFSAERQSAFTCVQRNNLGTPATATDRADSRASDSQLSGHQSDDKRPSSRLDDVLSVRSSPGTSPLVLDRHEAVNPYRDPELMRKNTVHSNVQNIIAAQHKLGQQAFPSVHAPVPSPAASSQSAATFASVAPLPARSLLNSMPFTSTPQLPPSISHHHALPHGYPMEAVVRAQQQQLAALQQQHLISYSLGTAPAMATLEALWQRKFPAVPLPPQYLLQKNQDALVPADLASAFHREHLQIQLEVERRERLDQERREKERKEIMERERQEKEKSERDKAERDRIERERQERERQEKERLEWENKQNQERILRESVDTEAAVEQHFAESLTRLASQQGINMFSSITRGTGRGLIPKSEHHNLPPPHGPPFIDKKHLEHRIDDQVKGEVDLHQDDERYVKQASSEKSSMFGGYPYGTSGYHAGSSLPQPGQKPFFNLYGYPSSHSTITPEQLKQRGLNPEPGHIKEEVLEKKPAYSLAPHAASPVHLSQAYPKDIKREPHNSVIVKREPLKMENLVAAHSHHNSPSSSSPRPQHPRPAHTPEHKPDRPLSSSTSPALGGHLHPLHHSSPAPSGPGHMPPSHSKPYSSSDAPPRSQSPYKPAASQSQPLNFCKTASTNKLKSRDHQQHPPGHTISLPQAPVSIPNCVAYSSSLVQQGLVPNPIYSQGGPAHSSAPLHQHTLGTHAISGHMSNSLLDSKTSQLSPSGSKRKCGSKDNSSYSRKKPKGLSETAGSIHPLSIPVTTPQIMTNPSPYTTTSSSNMFTKPDINSVMSSSPSSSSSSASLTGTNLPQVSSCFMDSFKSFVENTVQIAFLQDEREAKERAEKERLAALTAGGKAEPDCQERKPNSHGQPFLSGAHSAASGPPRQDSSQPATSDSYTSRIMDTINRVANNQVDTDSDTLSASSPPPQIKPSDTNSPLNKSSSSSNTSGSSHPHHMKKFWLQRHDEDKKSETPVPAQGEEDSNSSLSQARDIISCVENSSASLADGGQESSRSSPANVVVTLPNGGVGDLNHNDESTSSASESEMQSSAKVFGPKKRVKSRKPPSGSSKKVRSDGEMSSPTPPPANSNNSSSNNSRRKTNSSKRIKAERDSKLKDDPVTIRKEEHLYNSTKQIRDTSLQTSKLQEKINKPASPATENSPCSHSELSNPSPALSESNTANMSPSSSSSLSSTITSAFKANNNSSTELKDKKKQTRRSKEFSKDNKKSSSFSKPLVKMTVTTLKRTMMPFIQDGPCSEITPKLTKCRECKMTPVQRSKKQPNIFCRFYAFRRLKYNSRGIVTIDGFSELSDADPDDIEPWLPRFPVEEPELDVTNSKFIIAKVGDKFCELVEQEREAMSWAGEDVKIVWKRAVMGVREMCDVCDTTLFNMHWVCQKCGFVVCLDCYKVRMKEGKKALIDDKWLTCSSNRQAHKASEMMLTQIIPSDALWELGRLIHDIRAKWSIPSNCLCSVRSASDKVICKNGINQQLLNAVNTRKLPNGFGSEEHGNRIPKSKKQQDSNPLKSLDAYTPDTASSPLSILAEVASMEPNSNREKSDMKRKLGKTVTTGDDLEDSEKKSGCSTLRELLTKTAGKPKVTNDKKTKKGSGLSTLDDIIQSVVEKSCTDGGAPFKFLHYTPRLGGWKRELPIMVHSLTETSVLYPDVPHSWLCDGRLLRLHDAHHKGNLQIFQEQWKRGQPVVVSCANKKMNIGLWKPEMFIKEFGHIENEVVNCRTGDVIIGHTMGEFWDGFENLRNRPTDNLNAPMLLKLKDWPPGDDFSELLPSRFQDLMNALPLPEYTRRNGKLNLASRLPEFLVRPDLGPKMYNAYGSALFPKEGTTNLHLDISDAVNVMVYVGVPGDGPGGRKAQEEAALKAIDDAGCDIVTKRRAREGHEIPGALWHIYDAHDADKIRDFLNKVAKERGEIIEKDHDAIHDQSWYVDKELGDRLLKEYGVQGYPIVQCLGDAVFIPAGAPHQVRNLHSCVKVAEDFVSPEHLNHCFRLTQEFRQLSETHSNHEDKLQVKNIIYHAVKDAIAVLREHDPEDD